MAITGKERWGRWCGTGIRECPTPAELGSQHPEIQRDHSVSLPRISPFLTFSLKRAFCLFWDRECAPSPAPAPGAGSAPDPDPGTGRSSPCSMVTPFPPGHRDFPDKGRGLIGVIKALRAQLPFPAPLNPIPGSRIVPAAPKALRPGNIGPAINEQPPVTPVPAPGAVADGKRGIFIPIS